jgi:raffinose/stachyose/melibiose transport system permease protein
MPAVIVYSILFVLPVIVGFYAAMTDWSSYSDDINYIGFDNFRYIFQEDPKTYWNLLQNTVVFTIATTFLEIAVGLALALFMNMKLKTRSLLRSVYFIPYAISPIIIGIIFLALLKPNGPVNGLLTAVGLQSLTKNWLTDFNLAMPSVILVEVWRYVGLNMVIFLAGLQSIDPSYYEAADVEGANKLQKFLNVTIPYIMPALTINLVLNLVHGFRAFEIVFALTNGGPGSATELMNTAVFRTFSKGDRGLAAAMSLLVFIITTVVGVTVNRLTSRKEVEAI